MQPVDICNMALSEMGARVKISNLTTDPSPAAVHCNIWYDRLRQQLLRAAPWGFCRYTIVLTPTGSVLDVPADNQYPFMFNYAYPGDCLKVRYILPPPPPQPNSIPPTPGQPLIWYPWMMPNRNFRFVESNVNGQKMILANIQQAIAVYNGDVTDPTLFDSLFVQALSSALAEKLVLPLAGNVNLKSGFLNIANQAVISARVADGNEAMPTTDHTPDWIAVRGVPYIGAMESVNLVGNWIADWSNSGYGS